MNVSPFSLIEKSSFTDDHYSTGPILAYSHTRENLRGKIKEKEREQKEVKPTTTLHPGFLLKLCSDNNG
ncbi:hypothetical protein Csa_020425 [Cucumis sativus]|uniref:Uncharacterized protein n=1 Tax=Cucumis sativus TaxID=3659 RepID=A0A0A0K714_CUCSA|nr:hypothetical protein Csa_020425 [Cucumis sativus]